ncbi:MAG: PAS domain S-box protein, partial [Methanomassiliicoccales archaeon]
MQSEQFYRTIIHNAPLGYALYKVIYGEQGNVADLQFVEVNPAFEVNTGLNPADVLGKTITQVIPENGNSFLGWLGFCSEVDQDHQPRNYEEYFPILGRWYKGSIYWPAPGYLISLFYDVSVEQQAELDKNSLINSLFDVIFELDLDLRVTKIYTSDPGMLFLPEEQIIGLSLKDLLLDAQLLKIFEQAYTEAIATGISQTVEYASPVQADNRWFRAIVKLVNGQNGRSFQIVIRDITAQKRAENILQAFFTVASEYICICDARGNLLEVNQIMMDNMGISPDIVGRNVAEYAHPEDLPKILHSMQLLAAGKPDDEIVYRYRLRDGNYHYLEWTVTAYNELIYAAGRDITDKIMAAEELKRDNERMAKLVELLQQPFASYRQLIDFALEQGRILTGSRWGSFYHFDPVKHDLKIVAHTADAYAECQIKNQSLITYPVASSGVWTNTIHNGQPFYLNDYQTDNPTKKGYPEGHLPITRFLSVPVISSKGL